MKKLPLVMVAISTLWAQETTPTLPDASKVKGIISLWEENDKFSFKNKDRYYTQGLRISYQEDPHTFWSLTQEINTPSDTSNPNPPATDLPYSAALYLTYGYGKILDRGGKNDCLFIIEGDLGVIGPSALGETIQNRFHDLIGTSETAGWGTQVPDEIVLNVDIEFRRRFLFDQSGLGLRDLITRGALQLGTMRTEAILGTQFRWGVGFEQNWGQTFIRQGSAYNPQFSDLGSGKFSSWLFADAQVEVVMRNYATDGTNFRESRSVTRNPVVGQLAIGATMCVHSFELSYYLAMRSKEFETQLDPHYFGGFRGEVKF
ncbi:MAG: lipid A deacylase LpxR family protein [Verrucomicrobia bacterium]|nr:lipid A deacylase LpxR family protein [Verrucomicrobiota bacterium]